MCFTEMKLNGNISGEYYYQYSFSKLQKYDFVGLVCTSFTTDTGNAGSFYTAD